MTTRVLQIVSVFRNTPSAPRTIILYDPITKLETRHYCHPRHKQYSLGTYYKFIFSSIESITHICKLNGLETFNLRRELNK